MKKIKTLIAINAALIICGFAAGFAHAATYWASPNGSNGVSCKDILGTSDPGRHGSFARAVACATSYGDKVFVLPGIYTSNVSIYNPASGITISGSDPDPAKWPVLKPTGGTSVRGISFSSGTRSDIAIRYIKWDFSNVETAGSCVRISSGVVNKNFLLEDFECLGPPTGKVIDTGSAINPGTDTDGWIIRRGKIRRWYSSSDNPGAHGFYWQGDNGLVEHVEIDGCTGYGIQYYAGKATPDNNTFRYNTVRNCAKGIILHSSGSNNKVYGNLIINNTSDGIRIRYGQHKVWNNTIYGNGRHGIQVGTSGDLLNCELKNNISFNNSGSPIFGSCATQANNLTSDPFFVDPKTENFRLKANSPAIDKGNAISIITMDRDATSIPQGCCYDIGAFEYRLSTVKPPVPPSDLQATGQ